MVVDSVAAITSVHSDGFTYVTFQVLYTNGGNSPIYVIGGCGGGLTSTIEGNSSVLLRTTGGPLCDCAAYIVTLEHGQNNTSVGPGCWSGYYYRLVGHGTVTMNLTLGWSSNGQNFNQSNSTDIQAEFTF